MRRFLIGSMSVFSLMCLNLACKELTPVPIANVNFTTPIYTNGLVNVGGHEYFTGAIKGLVVYRYDLSTFYAYDRACSYDWENGGYVSVDDSNPFQLICGTCHSTYNILSGAPVGNVKADAPLRQYKTALIDDFNLRVYN